MKLKVVFFWKIHDGFMGYTSSLVPMATSGEKKRNLLNCRSSYS